VRLAPGIPHALCFIGRKIFNDSGASRREIAEVRLDFATVIARGESDEAIQLSLRRKMDCFACARNDGVETVRATSSTVVARPCAQLRTRTGRSSIPRR
jgi:hypothetical protein